MVKSSDPTKGKFGFRCTGCGEWHTSVPAFHVAFPSNFLALSETERAERCFWDDDACVIDRSEYYIRGLIAIPVQGTEAPFIWGVWVSVSGDSFRSWVGAIEMQKRTHIGPLFGWLDSTLSFYAQTRELKTLVHLRDGLLRPAIELEPTDHPLAVEQRVGIEIDRLAEIVAFAESRRTDEKSSALYTTVPCRS